MWGSWPGSFIYYLDGLNKKQQGAAGFNGVMLTPGHVLFDPAGVPVSPTNPLPVSDASTEAALGNIQAQTQAVAVATGTQADGAYSGTGNTTIIGGLKGIQAALSGGLTVGSVQLEGADGVHKATVNSDGSLLTKPESVYLSSPPTLTNGVATPVLTDSAGNALVNASASNGVQGVGSQYNPPTGGSGIIGYLSAIMAYVANALTVTINAGTNTIGTVLLGAGSAVIGAVTQSGAWVLSAGTALIGGVNLVDSGGTNKAAISAGGALSVASVAGSAIIGKVGIDQTTPGTTNGVQINAALPAGTNSIGSVTANLGAADIGTAGSPSANVLSVQGVSGGTPVSVSAASLPLPAGAAQDGSDATGVTPPAGAAGLRGWASAIYNQLHSSTVAVTGTFWQATQPVSAASLPLPSGAATAAKQPSLGTAGSPATDVITVQGNPSATPMPVSGSASAAGGSSTWSAEGGSGTALLSNTPVTVQGSATSLYTAVIDNTANPSAATYLQFFDTPSPTVGTTAPKFVIPVPAGGYWSQGFGTEGKVAFATALTVAATTTRTGATAPASPIAVTLFYK